MQYRKEQPEKAFKWRLKSAIRLLEKHGYIVTAPKDGQLLIEGFAALRQETETK